MKNGASDNGQSAIEHEANHTRNPLPWKSYMNTQNKQSAEKRKWKRSLFIGWDTVSKLSTKPHEYTSGTIQA